MSYISLSNSALDRLGQCPLSYFHAHLNPNKPEKKNVTTFYGNYGSLLHFFAEIYPRTNFYPDMEWKEGKVVSEDIDSYISSIGNQIMERKIVIDVEKMILMYDDLFPFIDFPKEETKEEYYKQGLEFIHRLPKYDWSKVIGLEKYFKISIDDDLPPVTGIIDKVERDERGLIVTDYKTSKPYSENQIKGKIQLPMYGLACYLLYGEFPYKYRYDFIRFNKVVEVEIPIDTLKRTRDIIKFKYMQIVSYLRSGKFPITYQDFYCKNFCGYSYLCPTYQAFNPDVNG